MSANPKPLPLSNADLVHETLTYFDAGSNSWIVWTGPATVAYCTKVEDAAGLATYTTIPGMGPFTLIPLGGANLGVFYYVTPASVIAILATDQYVNETIYQVIVGGPSAQLLAVQPRAVTPELNPQ